MNKKIKLTIIFFLFCFIFTSYSMIERDIEVGFSPGITAKYIILNAILNAEKSLDIAAYSFTNKIITLAIIHAHQRGVKVRIIADKKSNHNKRTAIYHLINHKVPIRLISHYSIMHNKFIIVDNKSVQTGSFNYTQNAESNNAENVIFIKNKPYIANQYTKEFNRLWVESIS
ncbi:MAG: phospholipase D family protein, partial [Candidatus Baumannia cicadellinicola]|nr:phospholipase D family protein [Candidatus Baumannia cicadellinicola]